MDNRNGETWTGKPAAVVCLAALFVLVICAAASLIASVMPGLH